MAAQADATMLPKDRAVSVVKPIADLTVSASTSNCKNTKEMDSNVDSNGIRFVLVRKYPPTYGNYR
ncbi:hypothetical protein B5M45_19350 [Mycobacterium simiae]|uniref:Uncharacterized protein n=1 Tax=Mycobacterium simiae TaxID=1784 RepID=A0A1X0XY50_MYCSI|nr:hypothetical protein B5M45_19350 [Mycobacterium simiae]